MRKRYVQLDGELVEVTPDWKPDPAAPMVYGDIQPYRSMITGEIIGSRSTHRTHLRQHGCIEVGNETHHLKPYKPPPLPSPKETIARLVYEKLRY